MGKSSKSKKSTKETKPKIKIVIGVPSGGNPEIGFLNSLSTLTGALAGAGIQYILVVIESCNLLANRYNIVQFALRQSDVTHILWIDDDMRFDIAAFKHLLAAGVPCVGVSVLKRKAEPIFTCTTPEGMQIIVNKDSTGLVKTDGLGLGMTLMDVNIFRLLDPPWFYFTFVPEIDDYDGEDTILFREIREKLGIDTYVSLDASKHVDHIGKKVYSWKDIDWDKYKPEDFLGAKLKNTPQEDLDAFVEC